MRGVWVGEGLTFPDGSAGGDAAGEAGVEAVVRGWCHLGGVGSLDPGWMWVMGTGGEGGTYDCGGEG